MCILDLFRLQMVVRVRKKKEGYYRRNKILSANNTITNNNHNKYNPKHQTTTTPITTSNLSTIDKMKNNKKKKEKKKNNNKQPKTNNCLKCRRQRSSSMSTTACLNPACDVDNSDFCCGESTRAASSPWGSVKTLSTQFTEGASVCLCLSDDDNNKRNDHLPLYPSQGDGTHNNKKKNSKNTKNKGTNNDKHSHHTDLGTVGGRGGVTCVQQGFEGGGERCNVTPLGKDNLGSWVMMDLVCTAAQ
ncbi:hypothetical protein Pcinc_031288 [Petrolisthes cinctipes]|uniref:Uncharacterized protein n=1 Tax=Petrolisthes cinctipes TaxID=88211 RepID=A0AAE1EWZ3_PETCI|nr:hypothetical protein Pcinc_031288 [Petrolisthes cinctipes]